MDECTDEYMDEGRKQLNGYLPFIHPRLIKKLILSVSFIEGLENTYKHIYFVHPTYTTSSGWVTQEMRSRPGRQ